VDSILVDGQPKDRYDALVRSDPIFGNGKFEQVRSRYQRGVLEDFREFQQGIERQRRRLFFSMPRGDADPSLDPWRLTIFSYGGEYLDFAAALSEGGSIDFVRSRLVTGLNRSYIGAMCDESQQVWFASPAANTQSRLGRVLDIEVPVGRNRRFTYYFDFDCDANLAHGGHEWWCAWQMEHYRQQCFDPITVRIPAAGRLGQPAWQLLPPVL